MRSRNALVGFIIAALAGAPTFAIAKPAKPAPAKRSTALTAEHKKALAELFAGFKFGMNKDEVLAVLGKQLGESYEAKIKLTTDIAEQDHLRQERKQEVARIASTYVAFDDKKTGWDVSIVSDEFAHNTDEAMMERWENQDGKNQRRFFFFWNGKLWKMFVSLDVSILPPDKKNFETFKGVMEGKYGPGDNEAATITWRAGEFEVRAVDHLHDYDALGLVIEDPKMRGELEPLRASKAPAKKETPAVIKAIIDPDNKDHPDIKANDGAVDAVIKAQGGGGKPAPHK